MKSMLFCTVEVFLISALQSLGTPTKSMPKGWWKGGDLNILNLLNKITLLKYPKTYENVFPLMWEFSCSQEQTGCQETGVAYEECIKQMMEEGLNSSGSWKNNT